MISLDFIQLFNEVYECRSFTIAASKLQISQPTISRKIGALEAMFNSQLFFVKGNQLETTHFADTLYNATKHELKELSQIMNNLLPGNLLSPDTKGKITIQLPVIVSAYKISPKLPELLNKYPELDLEVIYSNTEYDIVKNKIDICVINRSPVINSQLDYETIYRSEPYTIHCTREYADKFGIPLEVDDLEKHLVAGYISDNVDAVGVKLVHKASMKERLVEMNQRIKTNSQDQNLRMILSNNIIAPLMPNTVNEAKEIYGDRIIHVLPEWETKRFNYYVIKNIYRNQKNIDAIYQFLLECFAK